MRKWLTLAFVLLLARGARADSPYQLKLDLDIAVLVAGTALWAGSALIGDSAPPHCGTSTTMLCDPSSLNALDRAAIGHVDPSMRTVATWVGVVPFTFVLLDVATAGVRDWRGWLTDLFVIGEALAWDGALQDVVRRAVRRPRPFLYVAGAYHFERDHSEATFSFYSGHTSFAFTLAVSAAYTFHLRHRHSRWRWVVWPSLLAIASIEPIVRVLAGDHFPTDCFMGAIMGSAIGLLFPALHRRRKPKVAIAPVMSGDRVGISAAVLF